MLIRFSVLENFFEENAKQMAIDYLECDGMSDFNHACKNWALGIQKLLTGSNETITLENAKKPPKTKQATIIYDIEDWV